MTGPRSTLIDAFKQWSAAAEGPAAGERIAILCFRSTTWIEWAIYTALEIRRRGYTPVVMYSRRDIEENYLEGRQSKARVGLPYGFSESSKRQHRQFWEMALGSPCLSFVDLDGSGRADPLSQPRFAARDFVEAACLAICHDWRVEVPSRPLPGPAQDEVDRLAEMLASVAERVAQVLLDARPLRAVCPSGITSWSSAFLAAAKSVGVPVICAEFWTARPGHMIWRLNAPAVQHDLSFWRATATPWTAEHEDWLLVRRTVHMVERPEGRRGQGDHIVQRVPRGTPLTGALGRFLDRATEVHLLGTNVIGDSAVLGRSTIFASQRAWLQQVCEHYGARRDLSLVIRIHPDEFGLRPTRQRLGPLAKLYAAGRENVFVVDASDPVNTYDLIDRSQLGLVWMSNLGVDLVLEGKNALVAAGAYFLELGVGADFGSASEYLAAIDDPLTRRAPSPQMIQRAKEYYWIMNRALSLEVAPHCFVGRHYRLRDERGTTDRELFYRFLIGEIGPAEFLTRPRSPAAPPEIGREDWRHPLCVRYSADHRAG